MKKIALLAVIAFVILGKATRAQEVGDKLPPLNVTDWIVGSSDEVGPWGDGKVYVLEFWGTWCPPCLKIMPELTKMQKEYREKGLVVIGYSWEDPELLRKFVRKHKEKIGYTIVTDTEEKTLSALNENGSIQGFPYSYLVGEKGKILWKGNSKYASKAVAQHFAGKPIDVDDGPFGEN